MDLIKIPNGIWEKVCCDIEGYSVCEISTKAGYFRIRAKSVDGDIAYEMQRFGKDMLPLDSDYPAYHAFDKEMLIATIDQG